MKYIITNRWTRQYLIFFLLILFAIGQTYSKNQVCVIGAGMAGIAAIKQLSEHADEIELIAFEKNSDVGGLWIYSDSQDLDEHGLPVHSRVYKNLRTNFVKEAMTYPDYRHFEGRDCHSHVSHTMLLEYLKNYTCHFNLRQYVKFNTLVNKVHIIGKNSKSQSSKWEIQWQNLNTNDAGSTLCDYIMVCNGHYYTPKIPVIRGIETFTGRVIHSSIYRKPEEFTGKKVVVLGAGISGIDISQDVSHHAKTVYLSRRDGKITPNMSENVEQVRGVVAADGNQFILQDNSTIKADAIIYSTGYLYTFPFLDDSSGIKVDENFIYPLYKFTVNVDHPSMAFIGLPAKVGNPTFFSFQSKYFAALIRGKARVPNEKEMWKEARLPPGTPASKANYLGDAEWTYYTDFADQGGFDHPPDFYRKAAIAEDKLIMDHPANPRDFDLHQLDNGGLVYLTSTDTCPKKIII